MIAFLSVSLLACGESTLLPQRVVGSTEKPGDASVEICNGLDDDRDGVIDNGFRDSEGRYVEDAHCGSCDQACVPTSDALSRKCEIVEGTPTCVATSCAPGYAPSALGRCVPSFRTLCLACASDADCGDVQGAKCLGDAPAGWCAEPCGAGCPSAYTCNSDALCVPSGGSCECGVDDTFDFACALRDPEGKLCAGRATCDHGVASACVPGVEVCNGVDDNCDGRIDETFRDAYGVYSVNPHDCGACGIDCTTSRVPQGDLVCGGDPLAPTCVLSCPDALDGIQPGDRIDADRDIATGCECTVSALDDQAGPVGAVGEALDVNCDGADGIVVKSFYVATDGSDSAIGSPTRPLKTLGEALRRAKASLGTSTARPHVFVASGSYAETITLPDGVFVHGGYRRDFLALDPTGFLVEVRAPIDTPAPFGAALVANGAGATPTILEWLSFRGRDAIAPSTPAFGAVLVDAGGALTMRDLTIVSGAAGPGVSGVLGASGGNEATSPTVGGLPRAAVEDTRHVCIAGPSNVVTGGAGGVNSCGDGDVSGGRGGSAHCPMFSTAEPNGANGRGVSGAPGGAGGMGGQDSSGPVTGSLCTTGAVCCGLADFLVPTDFSGPAPGQNGSDGVTGLAGRGCSQPLGLFDGTAWTPGLATGGASGRSGSGGGGGGAGGGVEYDWFPGVCAFPDGLGGGGGGGGAGGCGGAPGSAGTSGGPSTALVLAFTHSPATFPSIDGVTLQAGDGGRGGDGGIGGAGGRGGTGALGGELPRAQRTIPPLAGPFPGARGGRGGDGGGGGNGGGGCGGASVGLWVTGLGTTTPPIVGTWTTANVFVLGRGGDAGRGGGTAGADGVAGGAIDVVVR